MTNILSISAIELVEKLKSGEVSCVDACKEYIKRIDKFENDVKAWAFRDKKLLLQSLTHKSFSQSINNEKLEFLGDRVLGLIISQVLLNKYPNEKEGEIDKNTLIW